MTVRDSEAIGVAWRRRRGVDEKKKEKKETDFVSNLFFLWSVNKIYYLLFIIIIIIIGGGEVTWTFRQGPLRHSIIMMFVVDMHVWTTSTRKAPIFDASWLVLIILNAPS